MHPQINIRPRAKFAAVLSAAAALSLGLGACGSDDEGSSEGGESSGSASGNVSVIAYSTPQEVYEGELQPAFEESNPDVEFSSSFASSGDQSRAVEAGQPADLVHLSLEPDVTRLVDMGLVAEDWQEQGDYDGILQESAVVFTVRGGNPKDIQDWDDLIREDVSVITPNPFTSGGARWNIMAAYGQVIENGGTEEEALQFVDDVLTNTAVQDASASDALETFTSGEGDVLLSYENEAIRAQNAGEDVDYVIPDETIRIETPVAIPTESENPEAAQAFLDFLYSPEGQALFAESGYRPVDPKVLADYEDTLPEIPGLFDIDEFGGWETVATEFFDPENGSVAAIEQELGVTTG